VGSAAGDDRSDLLRAAGGALIPVAAVIWIPLVYPMVILMTSISVFFRPARVTALPRMVRESDILPANSALWVGETLGDVIGYPIAASSCSRSGRAAARVLVRCGDLPRLGPAHRDDDDARAAEAQATPDEPSRRSSRISRSAGRFLRQEPVLLANTIQGAIGQFGTGIFTAVTYAYAVAITMDADQGQDRVRAIETGIGVGNLVGGSCWASSRLGWRAASSSSSATRCGASR
jgi:hypothetical protein